jgi:hypothetical protein
VIASGPGIDEVYWKTAKPYQPDSPQWEPRVIGCSGAVWLDADGDGRRSSARDYATRVLVRTGPTMTAETVKLLENFDAATATQAAFLLDQAGANVLSDQTNSLLENATPKVRRGFLNYVRAWRENQAAKAAARGAR